MQEVARRSFMAAAAATVATSSATAKLASVVQSCGTRSDLFAKLGTATSEDLARLRAMGATEAAPYTPNGRDQHIFREAIDSLAPVHLMELPRHLRALRFVHGLPNNAVTMEAPGFEGQYDIMIRAGVLGETAAEILTRKDRSSFAASSNTSICVRAGTVSGLTYTLLHEATHVLEFAVRRAGSSDSHRKWLSVLDDIARGVWIDAKEPVKEFNSLRLRNLGFGASLVIPSREIVPAYDALQETPFPSLYGSRSRSEDLAEMVAFQHMTHGLGVSIETRVDENRQVLLDSEQMSTPLVAQRLPRLRPLFQI